MDSFDLKAVRRAFGRAAPSYERGAALQHTVRERLLENLVLAKYAPSRIVDLGSGPGHASARLKKRWPTAQVLAIDVALPMLRQARRHMSWFRPFQRVAADAHRLPLATGCADLLFSNLCLQWCNDLAQVFSEFHRVLRPQGLLLFSTFGPRTLQELRQAWASVDDYPRVSRLPDMPEIGQLLHAQGFAHVALDLDTYTLTYGDAYALMRDLKSIGASNASIGRPRALGGKARMARMVAAYEQYRTDGRLPATYEVISGIAFRGTHEQAPARNGPGTSVTFSPEQLRGSRIRRAAPSDPEP